MKNKIKQHKDQSKYLHGWSKQKYILCVFVVLFSTAIIKSLSVGRKAVPWFKESSLSVGLT